MDYVAWWGRSLPNIGTGNKLLYHDPQGLSTLILNLRISVLILDSIVDYVAMIVDTRDNLLQWFFLLLLQHLLIETLSMLNTEKLQCVITETGGHWFACRWSIDWWCYVRDMILDYLANISRHQSTSLLVLCQIDLQCEPCPDLRRSLPTVTSL